ncbi:MAG: DUF1330 domain-containing protein [Mesorhizobium sp.]|nr:DUF1330 domain-containing protein [Mesorhizobium sp.]MCO5163677.1 DUF1330 domain-containing protein [Mesorhizobium sp.]
MAKGYWIAHLDILDPERYRRYVAANAAAFEKYGGRFLARAGRSESMLGTLKARHVIIEFPDYQAALDCYHSPEYRHAVAERGESADLDLVVAEGVIG